VGGRLISLLRCLPANRRRLIVVLLMAAASSGGAQTPPLDALADLELRDQYGGTDTLAAHRGETVVAMVVTAKRLRNLKAWERDFRDRFDGIHYLRIADIPSDPPTTYEQVARKLNERVPEDVSVLIDMDSAWATELELDSGRPNILVIDAEGTLLASFHGRHQPELAAEVVSAIEEALGGD
jgi:hypothetical protein